MTRRTYYDRRNQGLEGEDAGAEPPPPPPQPQNGGSSWLKTVMTIAVSAVVGAVAVDIYRRFTSKNRNPDDEGMVGIGPMGALPGGTSIMPMPLPLPMPWPMPMGGGYGGGFGQQVAPGYRDERPLTEQEKLELQRLKTEEAKAAAAKAQWESWEAGDDD